MSGQKVMLITGASGGIGAATARLAASRGYAVFIAYHSRRDAAESLAAAIQAEAGRADICAVDVREAGSVTAMFEQCAARLGAPTVLVNNAAATGPAGRRLADSDPHIIRQIVDTNLTGALLCARAALRCMAAGGLIINISSTATAMGSPGDWVDYAASKGAIDVMTRGLAREVAGDGIRVNAVAPGLVETELHARAGEPDRPLRFIEQIPLRRAARAEEIAEVIVWLAADAPEYLTGAIIPVSGGR